MPLGTTPSFRQILLSLERGFLYVVELTLLLAEFRERFLAYLDSDIPYRAPFRGNAEVEGHFHELDLVLDREPLGLALGRLNESLHDFTGVVRVRSGSCRDLPCEIPCDDRIDRCAAHAHPLCLFSSGLLGPWHPARPHRAYLAAALFHSDGTWLHGVRPEKGGAHVILFRLPQEARLSPCQRFLPFLPTWFPLIRYLFFK